MSVKKENILACNHSDECSKLLVSVADSRLHAAQNTVCTIKKYEETTVKMKVINDELISKTLNQKSNNSEYVMYDPIDCCLCKNPCRKCKSICVTCRSPCRKCTPLNVCTTSFTDTDDFDKYLDSQFKIYKPQVKHKTVGVDTCDLDSHFDYYKSDKKLIRIQKNVATDCVDLNIRKQATKKPIKNTVSTDTSDLLVSASKNESSDDEFFSNEKKTFKPNLKEFISLNNSNSDEFVKKENSLPSSIKNEEDDKENFNIDSIEGDITYDTCSTSDESDIDLITSCKLSTSRKLAKKHKLTLKQINIDNTLSYKCNICDKKFHKKYLGTLHLGSHIENNNFKCLNCSELFISLNLLLFHIQNTHFSKENGKKTNKTNLNPNTQDLHQNSIQKLSKIYQCALCSNESESLVQFDSYKALYLHKKIKHGITRSKIKKNEVKAEKKLRIKREFICLICGKQFKSSKALKDHSPVHTGEKNYHCDICNKSYTTSANLKIHKRTHTGARNFICTVCNKAFHKKDSLKVHFRKHSGERPFQCDLCPMKFDRNYILKNHRYTHFSEKTFICPICGKTFTTHGGLNNHEKSHKKDPFVKKPRKPAVKPTLDAENAVICDVCGKIYSTKSNLRIHKFVHLGVKPFECSICHQTYAKKDSMLTHMRKHTDERPFACETCGMTFYRNHTLKTHLLRHTGERPHKCKICGKSFTQSSSLAYHVKNHDRKVEKKRVITNDGVRPKKKRIYQGNGKSSASAVKKEKFLKLSQESDMEGPKTLFENKKSEESSVNIVNGLKESLPINLTEKNISKEEHFMLSVPEKEILIIDKNLSVELPKNINGGKEVDLMSIEKDLTCSNQYNVGKFNYYIAESHVFSFPKDALKAEADKNNEVENLIVSKNSYITKDGTLITLNRNSNLKDIKGEFIEIRDQRIDLKNQAAVPITGEILNAAFISDENGDVIPFSSMTLQGLNTDNVMISPVIPVDGDYRKGCAKNSKVALESKLTYNVNSSRISNDKSALKNNRNVINLKDPRGPQKIHIGLESSPFHFQSSVLEDGTLQGIPGFYNNVPQNEI